MAQLNSQLACNAVIDMETHFGILNQRRMWSAKYVYMMAWIV